MNANKHRVFMLLTSENDVYEISAFAKSYESSMQKVSADLRKGSLSPQIFTQQKDYLQDAARSALGTLHADDQEYRYRTLVILDSLTNTQVSFESDSNSAGLGYGIALALDWRGQRGKGVTLTETIFATGRIHPAGTVTAVGHIETKVRLACRVAKAERIRRFVIYYPAQNQSDVPGELQKQVKQYGGRLVAVEQLTEVLRDIIGKVEYDGPIRRLEPFKGLSSFTYEDRFRFFGRDTESRKIFRLISDNDVVVVSGPSGAGKSSIINAGVRKILDEECGPHSFVSATSVGMDTRQLLNWCGEQLQVEVAGRDKEELLRSLPSQLDKPTFWFFDHIEKLFFEANEVEQALWSELLYDIARHVKNLTVIFCLREEYSKSLKALPCFKLNNHKEIEIDSELKPEQWHDIIEKQALQSGVTFEAGLVDTIVNEAMRTGDNLPLVELMLSQLYIRRKHNQLTKTAYENMGGLHGIINIHAENTLKKIDTQIVNAALKRVFARLISVSVDKKKPPDSYVSVQANTKKHIDDHTVAKVTRQEDTASIERYVDSHAIIKYTSLEETTSSDVVTIIEALYEARLLVGHPAEPDTYRFAHDKLLTKWSRACDWVIEHRPLLELQQNIANLFICWQTAPERDKKDYLITGELLKNAQSQLDDHKDAFSDVQVQYIKQSESLIRHKLIQNAILYSCLAVLVIFAAFIGYEYNREKQVGRQEEHKKMLDHSTRLTELAKQEMDRHNYPKAMLLLLNALPGAYGGDRPLYLPAMEALQVVGDKPRQTVVLKHNNGNLLNAAFNSVTNTVITSSESLDGRNYIHAWNATSGIKKYHRILYDGDIESIGFSRDGGKIVVIGKNEGDLELSAKITIYQESNGEFLLSLPINLYTRNIASGSDGKVLVSSDELPHFHDVANIQYEDMLTLPVREIRTLPETLETDFLQNPDPSLFLVAVKESSVISLRKVDIGSSTVHLVYFDSRNIKAAGIAVPPAVKGVSQSVMFSSIREELFEFLGLSNEYGIAAKSPFQGHSGGKINDILISPNGRHLIIARPNGLFLERQGTHGYLLKFQGDVFESLMFLQYEANEIPEQTSGQLFSKPIEYENVTFSHDSSLLLASHNNLVTVWQIEIVERNSTIEVRMNEVANMAHDGKVTEIDFVSRDRVLVSSDNGTAAVWQLFPENISSGEQSEADYIEQVITRLPGNRSCLTPKERYDFQLPELTAKDWSNRNCSKYEKN